MKKAKKSIFISIICCWVLVLGLIISESKAQSFSFDNYVVSNWGMEEGLPQSSVNDIIQTKDGYIWLATFGGLVRFDGNTFTTFDRTTSPGMRSDRILHLYEANDGAIWLSTEDGFIRYNENTFTSFVISDDETQGFSPLKFDEDSEGRMWISTNSKIYKLENNKFKEVEVSSNRINSEKAFINSGGAMLAFTKGVYKSFGDSVYQVINLQNEITNDVIEVIEYPEFSGSYFIATNGDGVVKYEDGKFSLHTIPEFSPFEEIWDFSVDQSQRLWILGYGGSGIWDGLDIITNSFLEEIESLGFNSLLEDNEGNFWLGSENNGLFKLRPSQVKNIDRDNGLTNEQMLSLLAMQNGNYLFSTNCGGVFEWNGTDITIPRISEYLPNKCNWSMFEDSRNRFWFGSHVLYRTNSIYETGIEIDSSQGFTGVDIFAITEDSKGNIWIGALNGLFKYSNSTFQRFSTSDGLSFNDVRAIYEDSNGVLWIGTSAGLNKFENGKIQQVQLNSNEGSVQQNYIRAIYEDEDGVMWFGSYGNGIFRLKDEIVTNITVKDGLFDNIVSHIVEDELDNFWMGSNRGISRVSRNELNMLAEDSLNTVLAISLGLNDGMNTAETNGGFQPNVIQDENGNIYFPTVAGVAVVSTKELNPAIISPPTFIEQIRTSTTVLENNTQVSLPYNDAFLEIRFTALNFSDPDKLEFRYRLVGLNSNWINIEEQRRVLFTKIPPGDYSFEVGARNRNGTWNEIVASIGIEVIPPFWQTTWFYSLTGLFFLIAGPTILFIVTSRLQRENEKQRKFSEKLIESQENERRRIASELHDSLGQQILVIKNRAELAKSFLNQPEELKEELQEIIDSAVNSISDVRSISHGLRPVHLEKFGLTESLKHLMEQIEESIGFELSFYLDDIDGIIPQKTEINFYRVMQEAINNIIKHAEATEASITIQKKDMEIETKIWDDGKGFNQTDVQKISGLGFLAMRERVDSLNGILSVQSTIEQGTTIQINIPIE